MFTVNSLTQELTVVEGLNPFPCQGKNPVTPQLPRQKCPGTWKWMAPGKTMLQTRCFSTSSLLMMMCTGREMVANPHPAFASHPLLQLVHEDTTLDGLPDPTETNPPQSGLLGVATSARDRPHESSKSRKRGWQLQIPLHATWNFLLLGGFPGATSKKLLCKKKWSLY